MKRFIWAFTCVFMIYAVAQAQNDDARKRNFNTRKNIAMEGYDPVSYFDSQPLKGAVEYSVTYRGVTYLFANAGNAEKFKQSPDKYEPAYGGWCAYAMGESGDKVKVDPETFKVLEGKLYLFYNFWGNNTLSDWNKNEKELKRKGDQNWKKFVP
jgi:YHS domain-containing protein